MWLINVSFLTWYIICYIITKRVIETLLCEEHTLYEFCSWDMSHFDCKNYIIMVIYYILENPYVISSILKLYEIRDNAVSYEYHIPARTRRPRCYFPTSHQVNHLSKVMETTWLTGKQEFARFASFLKKRRDKRQGAFKNFSNLTPS